MLKIFLVLTRIDRLRRWAARTILQPPSIAISDYPAGTCPPTRDTAPR